MSTAQAASASFDGFRVRRIVNPRYRPPDTRVPLLGATHMTRVRALDHVRASVSRLGSGGNTRTARWELVAGEQYQDETGYEVTASGIRQGDGFTGRTARLDARRGDWRAGLGDLAVVRVPASGTLQSLRGGQFRQDWTRDAGWSVFGGVPTPRPGSGGSRLRLFGFGVDGASFEDGRWDAAVVGLRQRDPFPIAGRPATAERRSIALIASARVPLVGGALRAWWDAQRHTGDGVRTLAGREAVEWAMSTPRGSLSLRDERGSRDAMAPGGDRWVPAATSETRWNGQVRLARGFAEAHLVGLERRGGDASLALGTVQLGVSGRVPGAPWYGGVELSDSRRGLETTTERRVAAFAGFAGHRGWVMSTRVEHVTVGDGEGGAMSGELSCALPHGGQLGLDPRAGWTDGRIERAGATLRLSAPLGSVGRVTGLCALEGQRERNFRGVLSEVSLAVSLAPRPRDRGDLELRRLDEGGALSTEWSTDYEVQTQRFEGFDTGPSARDSNRVHIRVAYATNGVGLKDVLVSLDGQQFRYTDSAGDATFDHVPRGTHLVALESGSLPEGLNMVTSSRLFVTVDRAVSSNFVMFQVERPVVIKRF